MTPRLRLLADDITGALDTAAEMTGLCGPVRVAWDGAGAGQGSLAIDAGTREATRDDAIDRIRALAPMLPGTEIAFAKLDSLLRGQVAAQIAACFGLGAWTHCLVAPAFPAQGRVTRNGRQFARQPDGGWAPVGGDDLPGLLAAEGLVVQVGSPPGPGITVLDTETEDDLRRIVAHGRRLPGPVLWCGSGGLARALAGDTAPLPSTVVGGPVLGLFGSDQSATARQLAACGGAWVRIGDGHAADARMIAQRMAAEGAALASVALPPGLARTEAAQRIGAAMTALTHRLDPPGTLVVAGGETLRAICAGLGATHLDATGIVAPGIPRSVMRGGAWDGVPIISKSGAFGGDTLWRDLLAANGLTFGSIDA